MVKANRSNRREMKVTNMTRGMRGDGASATSDLVAADGPVPLAWFDGRSLSRR